MILSWAKSKPIISKEEWMDISSYCGSTKHNRDACPKAWPGPNPIKLEDGLEELRHLGVYTCSLKVGR